MSNYSISRMDSMIIIPDSVYKSISDNVYNAFIVFENTDPKFTGSIGSVLDPQYIKILTSKNCGEYFPDAEDINGRFAIEKIPYFVQYKHYYNAMQEAFCGHTKVLKLTKGPYLPKNHTTTIKFFAIENTKCIGVVMQDITELIDAKMKAEEAANIKNLFTANMSHEIRTPLGAIIGLVKLLENTTLDATQKQYLKYMNQSCNALMTIINDVLDYAKLESGKINLRQEDFVLRKTITDTCKILENDYKTKKINLSIKIDPEVPHCCIGDASRFSQIILNLLSNAIKFTDEYGSIKIRCKFEGINSDNTLKLHFSVKDTGIGISKEDQNRLFKPYSQLDNSNTKKYKGTGLGLLIAKKLVNLMGGEIWVDSVLGEGSTFVFYLRVKGCNNNSTKLIAELNTIGKGKKVLIVDDNAANRLLLIKIVKSWGMTPSVAASVVEAEALLEDSDFSLGLIDIIMPEQNGDDLAKIIRRNRLGFPLIALSSMDEYNPQNSPFTIIMNKPIDEEKLTDCVFNLLSNETPLNTFSLVKPTKSLRILSVEDHATNQLIICNYLQNMGFKYVEKAGNGQIAVEKCTSVKYDAIFMDIKMPIMDGITAMKLIRDHYHSLNHSVFIIALTAQAMEEDEERFRQDGFDGYITKPINIDKLKQVLNSI